MLGADSSRRNIIILCIIYVVLYKYGLAENLWQDDACILSVPMRTDVEMGIKSDNFSYDSSYGSVSVVGLYHTGNVSVNMVTCVDGELTMNLSIAASLENLYNDSDVWVNLTNGIEVVRDLDRCDCGYNFCRFQSTSFEQHDWGAAIDSMPDDMLVNLAVGKPQTIIDFGANKNCPRAMRQGIPIAADILAHAWDIETDDKLRIFSRDGKNLITVDDDTRMDILRSMTNRQRSRLNYFKKYVCTDKIEFTLLCGKTTHDNDYDLHVDMLHNCSKCIE